MSNNNYIVRKKQVTYQGKEYEVRWEDRLCGDVLVIYEIKTDKIFNVFKTTKYIEVFLKQETEINDRIRISKQSPDFYIEQIKELFKRWYVTEKEVQTNKDIKDAKLNQLEEWDGIL